MPHRGHGPSQTQARYLEQLSDRDLVLLAEVADLREGSGEPAVRRLRGQPDLIERALSDAQTFERLFDLQRATFVSDWVGPRQRVPVMDTDRLRSFAGDRVHRLFLAELLASYTKVASGALWVQSRKGWRRQRFSELDPVRLAALIDVVRSEERPGIYRRLGDLALFLTGVFPDHSSSHLLGRIDVQRLLRSGATEEAP